MEPRSPCPRSPQTTDCLPRLTDHQGYLFGLSYNPLHKEIETKRGILVAREPRSVQGPWPELTEVKSLPAHCSNGETEAQGLLGSKSILSPSLEPPTLTHSRKQCFSFLRRGEERERETETGRLRNGSPAPSLSLHAWVLVTQ